jgi:hypothetical protein
MKKIILLLTALLLTAGVIQSQVKIGQDANPEKGAILDLNGTAYKGGLLLPNVDITDLGKIPDTFTDESVRGLDDAPNLAGLLVWNTHPGSEGVYMWDGADWQLLTEDSGPTTDCSGAPAIASISGFSGAYNLNAEFDVTCNATTSGISLYTWSVPAGLTVVSGNGTKTIRLKGATAGTYDGSTISCTVSNTCGSVMNAAETNMTVNNCESAPASPGPITLSVTTAILNQTFTASINVVPGASSYVWTLPPGLTGSSTTNSIDITGSVVGSYEIGSIEAAAINQCGVSLKSKNGQTVTIQAHAIKSNVCGWKEKGSCVCPEGTVKTNYVSATESQKALAEHTNLSPGWWHDDNPSGQVTVIYYWDEWHMSGPSTGGFYYCF